MDISRFSLKAALAFMATLAALFAAGHYAVKLYEADRDAYRMKVLRNQFRGVSLALQIHNDHQKRLPAPNCYFSPFNASPAARVRPPTPLYSWRLASVPYLESTGSPGPDFDSLWSSPSNARFRMATGFNLGGAATAPGATDTGIFAITGPDTAFGEPDAEQPHSLKGLDPDTILCVEVANSGVHWMQPGDFDIRTMPTTIGDPKAVDIEGVPGFGFHLIFADGEVWRLSQDTPFSELQKFVTLSGAKANECEDALQSYRME